MDERAPHASAGPGHDQPHVGHGILSYPLIRLRILAACRNLSQVRKHSLRRWWIEDDNGAAVSSLASITSLNSAVVSRSSAASKPAPGSSLPERPDVGSR